MSAPPPKRIGNANGDVRKLNEWCTNVSVDTYNYIRDLENRLAALETSLDGKVSETITDYSSKATVVSADQTYIADSAASNAIKRVTMGVINTFINAVSALITTYSAKSPVTGADQVYVADSAAGNAIKRATLTDVVSVANAVNATITTYSAKSPVVGADQIYIADSAAADAIKRATLSDAILLASGAANPYITPPASANAFDDEFSSGSNDLATRGWTIKTSGGTVLTRSGDIQPFNTTGPTGNTYWSRLTNSYLLIQLPVSTSVWIYKSITLSAGDTYWARVGSNYRYDSGGNANFQEVGFYATTGTIPDANNRAYVSHYETATSMNCDMAVSKTGVTTGTSRAIYAVSDIRGVRYKSGTDYFPFVVNSQNGQSFNVNPASGSSPTAANLVFFAMFFTAPAGGNTPNVHSIDFVRKSTSDAWIAP